MPLTDAMSNLFQNKLFLQYLSGAGADISAGNPIGTNVNAVTNQAISAQNFSKLLAQILGQGGKANIDKEKMKLDIPTSALGEMGDLGKMLFPEAAGSAGMGGATNLSKVTYNPFR